jgi:hypothetical protein
MIQSILKFIQPSDRVVLFTKLSRDEVIRRVTSRKGREHLSGTAQENWIELGTSGSDRFVVPQIAFRGDLIETKEGLRINGAVTPSSMQTTFSAVWAFVMAAIMGAVIIVWTISIFVEGKGAVPAMFELLGIVAVVALIIGAAKAYLYLAFASLRPKRLALLADVKEILAAREGS